MGRVALKTIRLYLAAICSIYINYILLVAVFENTLLYYMLNRATSFNPNILAKIATSSNLILGVNTYAAFCLAFIGCLHIGKIFYTKKQRSKPLFAATKATCLDVQFSPSRDYLTFYLK